MKQLVLLGSTGSIGTQTLDVIDNLSDDWKVIGMSANSNIDLLEKQARKYLPKYLVIKNDKLRNELKLRLEDFEIEILTAEKGLEFLASEIESDIVINSIVGAAGLKPTIAALKAGRKIGLANKESLVIGGEIIKRLLCDSNNQILPIDSEHNAIFQILNGHNKSDVKNIILTASGGPFRDYSYKELKDVSVKQALNHPNWDMGGKISIDSATMMNKGLEVIEAHFLFNLPYDNIKVVVHPESIIHSMVELVDNSIIAEMGVADMRMPIQYTLTFPERRQSCAKELDFFETGKLSFERADLDKFPALKLAYQAGKAGGTMPVVLNAANEEAVSAFMNGLISFIEIPKIIEKTMDKHTNIKQASLEDIYGIDNWSRRIAKEVMQW
ncbi:1-deoxy-D-xylulose-5-phosphate reductoisomerase [Halanaerobiaceae bacterium ANBcell28]